MIKIKGIWNILCLYLVIYMNILGFIETICGQSLYKYGLFAANDM